MLRAGHRVRLCLLCRPARMMLAMDGFEAIQCKVGVDLGGGNVGVAQHPTAWVKRMRGSMARLTSRFSANRAVRE